MYLQIRLLKLWLLLIDFEMATRRVYKHTQGKWNLYY